MTYNLTLENKYFKISTFGREGLALYEISYIIWTKLKLWKFGYEHLISKNC